MAHITRPKVTLLALINAYMAKFLEDKTVVTLVKMKHTGPAALKIN